MNCVLSVREIRIEFILRLQLGEIGIRILLLQILSVGMRRLMV
jgi:hypothetical protein